MKSIFIKKHTLILLLLVIVGCDDGFSPKGSFENGYSFFCIINGNTSVQKAYVAKNYNPPNIVPGTFEGEKSIPNAKVSLFYNNSSFSFYDSTLLSEEDGRVYYSYFLENFSVSENQMTIVVELDDGSVLSSNAMCTGNLRFSYDSQKNIVYNLKDAYRVAFYDKNDAFYFSPKLFINYEEKIGNAVINKRIEVPRRYLINGNDVIPEYPDLAERLDFYYPILMIENTLNSIKESALQNSIIVINNLTLEVLEVSEPLAAYFEVNKTFNDGFTIKSQQPEYSNINGGKGIFGYKYTSVLNVGLDKSWENLIADMGYLFQR